MRPARRSSALLLAAALGVGGAHAATAPAAPVRHQAELLPPQSRYKPLPRSDTWLTGATILDGAGNRIEHGEVLMRDGRIVAVGHDLKHEGAVAVDATRRFITPGIIDIHTHYGVYLLPQSAAEASV